MENMTKYLNIAYHHLESLYIKRNIDDIDGFKFMKDNFGHRKGDDVILAVKGILKNVCSKSEYVCRMEGEGFLIFLEGKEREHAFDYAKQILRAMKNIQVASTHITNTIKIAYAKEKEVFQDVFKRADSEMYLAKKNGRSQIEMIHV